MMAEFHDLLEAFAAAYRPHVEARCAALEVEPPNAAIDAGERWLRGELQDLLALPFGQQRRGPLELFQEAMRFPTAELSAAGMEPVIRNEVAATAMPGDLFDLAPASSQDLGESAWHAHLRWGATKAAALRAQVRSGENSD